MPDFQSILDSSVDVWNEWRAQHPDVRVNLRNAQLDRRDLQGVDLHDADLSFASLPYSDLSRSNLQGCNLTSAVFYEANLCEVNLNFAMMREACFADANMIGASIREAFLVGADLTDANLRSATLVQSDLTQAKLTRCAISGISAWDLLLDGTDQTDLNIAHHGDIPITVDDLEIAQFVYLLLNSPRIREVIDAISRKVVLILGRFTSDRKAVLDAVREQLRARVRADPV